MVDDFGTEGRWRCDELRKRRCAKTRRCRSRKSMRIACKDADQSDVSMAGVSGPLEVLCHVRKGK